MLVSDDKRDQRIIKTLEELVDTYNPETEVIIVFWPADEEHVYWLVCSYTPAPPRAVNQHALHLRDIAD
jgi:hypothetical protein